MIASASAIKKIPAITQDNQQQYDELWKQDSATAFQQWNLNGVGIHSGGQNFDVTLLPGNPITCRASDIDGGSAHYDAHGKLCAGKDPQPAGSYDQGINYYNGGSFYYGTLLSPIHQTQQPITTIIASWNAITPAGTWMEIHVRVLQNHKWSHGYILPIWASDFSTIQRHSVDEQNDATGTVSTDTFFSKGSKATAYQLGVTLFSTSPTLSPSLHLVDGLASNDVDAQHTPSIPSKQVGWGINLPVPQRSQMLSAYNGSGYGGGGEVWCSPTSTSMIMAYWSQLLQRPELTQTVPNVAKDIYDATYQGTGNWPNNTATAASFPPLRAFVTRMYSMSQVEQWINLKVPLVISIAYGTGQLPGSPIPSSSGHLIVIRGFTNKGDVITNDTAAATNEGVQITYPRAILEKLWLDTSHGTAYVIYPTFWPIPSQDRLRSW